MSRFKVQPFKDPLATTGELKFSEAINATPENDFTLVIRRSQHGRVWGEQMSMIRRGEFSPRTMEALAEKYAGDDSVIDFENLTDEQMAEVSSMDEVSRALAPWMVEDILDLPIGDDSKDPERVRLSDHPDEFMDTVTGLCDDWPELARAITSKATELQQVYGDYLKAAKKDSGSTSTPRRDGQQQLSASGNLSDGVSISDSEKVSALGS